MSEKPQIIFNPIYYKLEADQIAPFLGVGMVLIALPAKAIIREHDTALQRACKRLDVEGLVEHLIQLPSDAKPLFRSGNSDPNLNVLELATEDENFRSGLTHSITLLVKAIEGNPDFYFKQCSDILIHNFNIELALAPRNSPEAVTRLRMYPYYYIDNQQDDLPARCIRKVEQEIETLPPLLRHYREKEVIDIAIQPSMGYSALLPAIRTIVIGSVVLELETPKLQKSLAQTMLREELRRSADVAIGFSKTTHWMDACEEQLRTGVDDAERFLAARQFISKSNPQLYHKPTLQQYKESGWPIAGEMLVRYLAAKDELEILHSLAGCINPLSWVIMTKNKEGYVDAELAKLFPDVHNLAKNFEKQLEASLNHKHGVARKLTGRG